MHRVFQPPRPKTAWSVEWVGAFALVLLIFGVLPFTTAVSASRNRQLLLSRVDVAPPPPQAEVEEVRPPPEEKPPEEKPPELNSEAPPPLNLSVSLEVAVGTGGMLPMAGFQAGEGGAGLDAFDVADLERRPEVISQVPPAYPAELRKARIEGMVTIVLLLDDEGRVQDPRVENSSRPEFEKPALEAVRRWRFKPGMKEGKPVKTYLRIPIRFRISNS